MAELTAVLDRVQTVPQAIVVAALIVSAGYVVGKIITSWSK